MKSLRSLASYARFCPRGGPAILTLVFLARWESARLPAIREAPASVGPRHAPFTVSVGAVARSEPPTHPRCVLWADVQGDTAALKARSADTAWSSCALGFEPDFHEYALHLTLARSKESAASRRF